MDRKDILKALRPLKAKIYLERTVKIILSASVVSGLIALAMALVSMFAVIPFVRYKMLAVILSCLALAFIASLFFVPDTVKVILTADSLGLNERIITAWYFIDDPSEVAELQRQDTKRILDSTNLASEYKIKTDRKLYIIPVFFIAAAFLLTFIPGRVSGETRIRESLEKQMKQAEKAIEKEIESQKQKNPEISDEQLRQLKEALEKLKEEFRKAKTEEDALKALAQMGNRLEKLKEQVPLKDLNILENALNSTALTKDMADALKNKDEAALQEAKESLSGELENEENIREISELLQQAAMNMADGSMLAEALQNLASRAAAGDLSGKELVQGILDLIRETEENITGQEDFEKAVEDLAGILGEARKAIASVDQRIASSGTGKQGQAGNNGNTGNASGGDGKSGGRGKGGSGNQGENQDESGEGSGNENQDGNGSGNGGGTGNSTQGRSSGGAGEGSTNTDSGYYEGRQSGGTRTPGEKKEEEYRMIYVPERLGGSGNESTLPGHRLDSGSSTYTESAGPVQKGEMVPYREVLSIYREEAVRTMDRMDIPPGMKELVKSYFSSLE